MTLNDRAVITPALGYVWIGAPGTARPDPADLAALDPLSFGADTAFDIKVTGTPSGGTLKLTVPTGTTKDVNVPFNATAAQVQSALETLTLIGAGNVQASGTNVLDAAGVTVTLAGKLLSGSGIVISADATALTGGTSPAATAAKKTLAVGLGWEQIGHTSRDELPEFGRDGGDTETRGTWQNESLREVTTEAAADYMTMQLHQFDSKAFELYFGANVSTTPGVFGVSSTTAAAVEKAIWMLIIDGTTKVGFYAPKASIRQDDSISLAVDEFATLPIRCTFMKYGTAAAKYEWVSPLFT
jgi:hypothetical protein